MIVLPKHHPSRRFIRHLSPPNSLKHPLTQCPSTARLKPSNSHLTLQNISSIVSITTIHPSHPSNSTSTILPTHPTSFTTLHRSLNSHQSGQSPSYPSSLLLNVSDPSNSSSSLEESSWRTSCIPTCHFTSHLPRPLPSPNPPLEGGRPKDSSQTPDTKPPI